MKTIAEVNLRDQIYEFSFGSPYLDKRYRIKIDFILTDGTISNVLSLDGITKESLYEIKRAIESVL